MVGSQALAVDLTPIADAKHPDHDALVLNVANDPPDAHAVLPVTAELLARESFANVSRIGQAADAVAQKTHQADLDGFIKFA